VARAAPRSTRAHTRLCAHAPRPRPRARASTQPRAPRYRRARRSPSSRDVGLAGCAPTWPATRACGSQRRRRRPAVPPLSPFPRSPFPLKPRHRPTARIPSRAR
jgi:hypothetical protein